MLSLFEKFHFHYEFQMETFPLGKHVEMKIRNYMAFPMHISSFPPVLVHDSAITIKATFISNPVGEPGPVGCSTR